MSTERILLNCTMEKILDNLLQGFLTLNHRSSLLTQTFYVVHHWRLCPQSEYYSIALWRKQWTTCYKDFQPLTIGPLSFLLSLFSFFSSLWENTPQLKILERNSPYIYWALHKHRPGLLGLTNNEPGPVRTFWAKLNKRYICLFFSWEK